MVDCERRDFASIVNEMLKLENLQSTLGFSNVRLRTLHGGLLFNRSDLKSLNSTNVFIQGW